MNRMLPSLLLLLLIAVQIQSTVGQISRPWINEFHYDNRGTDVNEFVEIAAPEGLDVSSYQLILYNGFYSKLYTENAFHPLDTFTEGETVGGITFYYKVFEPAACSFGTTWCGLQNGRDGFALANYFTDTTGRVIEFLSYEGTFTAQDGPATNMTSTNIGVFERTVTPIGYSIQKIGIGCDRDDFTFALQPQWSRGTENQEQTITCQVAFINEFHYDNDNEGQGQFIEVASNLFNDEDSGFSVVLYNGEDGLPYDELQLSQFTAGDTDEEYDVTFYYYEFPRSGDVLVVNDPYMVNGTEVKTAAGFALVFKGQVLEFWSYGGEPFVAQGGAAEGLKSTDIGVSEDSDTPEGSSIQMAGIGCASKNFQWAGVTADIAIDVAPSSDAATPGAINVNQELQCLFTPDPEPMAVTTPRPPVDDDFLDADKMKQTMQDAADAANSSPEDDDFLDPETTVVYDLQKTGLGGTMVYEETGDKVMRQRDRSGSREG